MSSLTITYCVFLISLINTQLSAAVGWKGPVREPLFPIFPEWLLATSLAAAAAQSILLPQIVKRSISSRSFLGVLCFISEASWASSSSSSFETDGAGGSSSALGDGVGGWLSGVAGEASVSGRGKKLVLGVG